MIPNRICGVVKRTFPTRGFFWLAGEDGTDYFGHQSHVLYGDRIEDSWIGQPVCFTPRTDNPKGPYAVDIELIKDKALDDHGL